MMTSKTVKTVHFEDAYELAAKLALALSELSGGPIDVEDIAGVRFNMFRVIEYTLTDNSIVYDIQLDEKEE